MIFKLLTETEFEGIEYKSELCEKTQNKRLYIEGITLQSNIKNRNGRMYPEQVLDEAVNKHILESQQMNLTMEGELKHPKENAHEVNEDRISHRFVEVTKNGNNWHTKALILDTNEGKQIKSLLEGGVKLGISSRCLGQVKNSNGMNVVQAGLRVVTLGDIVRRPSAPDAMIDAIYEGREWVYENGILIEKDISEQLDKYKEMIKKTTKKDRAKVFEKIITDYFKTIKL